MSNKSKLPTILVIDDDAETCEVIELSGSLDGYRVRVACNPEEAIDVLEIETPELILLDYYGVGGDLQAFVARVRARSMSVPIVLMTGANAPHVKARELGLKDYLKKPFDSYELQACLKRYHVHLDRHNKEHADFSLFT